MPCAGAVNVSVNNQSMNYRNTFIILFPFLLIGCNNSNDKKSVTSKKTLSEKTKSIPSHRTTFLIDHCDINLLAELKQDIRKGNDSCVLRIRTLDKKMIKIETLNVPVDRSSITNCEKDYVAVGSSCGGPCYSKLFVFTDNRKNRRFDYCNVISNNSNIVAFIKNENFDKLYVHNLKNSKEIEIEIDNYHQNPLIYCQLDTTYIVNNILTIKYSIENEGKKKKVVNLEKILN
jgi:hypothetical protein